MRRVNVLIFFVVFLSAGLPRVADALPALRLEVVAKGFDAPVLVVPHPVIPERLVVVEQRGSVQQIQGDTTLGGEPFLDLSDHVALGVDSGLLSFAFHPKFVKTGKVYALYTTGGQSLSTVLSVFQLSHASGRVDAKTEKVMISVPQPFDGHNGGDIVFGKDSMLYVALGDGGGVVDPRKNGQNLHSLLGKILRIDVDFGESYAVPPDNPFFERTSLKRSNVREEIWAYGFQQPWRFALDSQSGALWVGDRGSKKFQELNRLERGGNFGWSIYEGSACLEMRMLCTRVDSLPPAYSYDESQGKAITAGIFYRGEALSQLQGQLLFADYKSGRLWALNTTLPSATPELLMETKESIVSIGEDQNAEPLIVGHRSGTIYRLVASSDIHPASNPRE